jgi:cellulose synthase (UDP-forming)
MILDISRSGPVLAELNGPRRHLRRSTFVPALRRLDRVIIAGYSLAWLICVIDFWAWWLEPVHHVGTVGIAVNSAVLLYMSGFPLFFIMSANRLRKVNPGIAVPLLRVAFVVTRAPSEPWALVKSTLSAMLAQDFPFGYDVWLCDEKPTGEIFDWCVSQGVKLSTRSGITKYHRESWPRRTACKEGNLAYFYDRWGYHHYDVVAQLDCDHKPAPTYLTEIVRAFSDPAIGYVAAPSVCDANADKSWAARGRLHKEATFHGPFQLGHSDGLGPLCIGSHYAVRTRALRDIGGLGPDLAEDFSTTFLLNTAGWHGAFAIDAEAHGEGPNTFAAMLTQEFQWSRSLTTVLLGLVPRHLRRLPWILRVRFTYALSYYVLLATTTLGGLALAPIAAVTGLPWMNVNYLGFLAHWWSISIWLLLIVIRLRRRKLLRPPKAPFVSWENWLYSLTRWPYVAMGVCAGVLHRLRPKTLQFKVTPKAVDGLEPLSTRAIMPFFVISVLSSSAAIVGELSTNAAGYVFLSLLAGATYAIVALTVPLLHAREVAAGASVSYFRSLWATTRTPLLMALVALAPVCLGGALYPTYLEYTFGTLHFGIQGFDIHHLVIHGFGKHAFGL